MFGLTKSTESRKMAGPAFIILNIIRVMNITSLLTAVVGSWIMLIRTVQTSNFFFFDGVSHFSTSAIGLFLIISELSVFKAYFAKYWPLLSDESSFLFLGGCMFIVGFNILGNLNKNATSVENLGLPLWRVVIAGGILSSTLGFANVVASFCFGNRKEGISARMVRSQGAAIPPKDQYAKSLSSSGSVRSNYTPRTADSTLPSYHAPVQEKRASRFNFNFPLRNSFISKPTTDNMEQFSKFDTSRSSPVIPDVQRPPTALHPAYSPARYSASQYSVASRF